MKTTEEINQLGIDYAKLRVKELVDSGTLFPSEEEFNDIVLDFIRGYNACLQEYASQLRDKDKFSSLKPYLNHLPSCNLKQNWDEAIQAMGDTPERLRDEDWQNAYNEMHEKMNTCTCGLKALESKISALWEAKDQYGYPLAEASNKVSPEEAKEPTKKELPGFCNSCGSRMKPKEAIHYICMNPKCDEYLKTR